jgi:hypothetical protein
MRAMGEIEYHEFISHFAARAHLPSAILFICMPALCVSVIGFLFLYLSAGYFSEDPQWGFYFAYGFLGYALAIGVWGPLAFLRFRREGMANKSFKPTLNGEA